VVVEADEHSSFALSPTQDIRVGAGQRQVIDIADTNGVERLCGTRVVANDGMPECSARVLVEQLA
jgi:hypothetical protein